MNNFKISIAKAGFIFVGLLAAAAAALINKEIHRRSRSSEVSSCGRSQFGLRYSNN
ncbi:MAG: hypothetical protein PHO56_04970 [Patescibacteria group bacterium]|nr:hypothetical protein [Patescibacteria group bacterium]